MREVFKTDVGVCDCCEEVGSGNKAEQRGEYVCEVCYELLVYQRGSRTVETADLSRAVRFLLKKLGHEDFQ